MELQSIIKTICPDPLVEEFDIKMGWSNSLTQDMFSYSELREANQYFAPRPQNQIH